MRDYITINSTIRKIGNSYFIPIALSEKKLIDIEPGDDLIIEIKVADRIPRFRLEITENGTVIEEFASYKDAMAALEKMESEDERNNELVPGYICITEYDAKDGAYNQVYDSLNGKTGEIVRKG